MNDKAIAAAAIKELKQEVEDKLDAIRRIAYDHDIFCEWGFAGHYAKVLLDSDLYDDDYRVHVNGNGYKAGDWIPSWAEC